MKMIQSVCEIVPVPLAVGLQDVASFPDWGMRDNVYSLYTQRTDSSPLLSDFTSSAAESTLRKKYKQGQAE